LTTQNILPLSQVALLFLEEKEMMLFKYPEELKMQS
jgi:hypothetical protein